MKFLKWNLAVMIFVLLFVIVVLMAGYFDQNGEKAWAVVFSFLAMAVVTSPLCVVIGYYLAKLSMPERRK